MHTWIYVHSFCQSSRNLAFADKILQRVRGEKLQLKNPWIFLKKKTQKKKTLDLGISSWLSISAGNDFSSLRRYIFGRRNFVM